LILLAALSILQANKVRFIELPDASDGEVRVEAVIKLPPMDDFDRADLQMVVNAVARKPAVYTKNDLLTITQGRLVQCEVMADHLRIDIPAAADNVVGAIDLLSEILTGATIDEQEATPNDSVDDPWEQALHGSFYAPLRHKRTHDELNELLHFIVRPERLTVAVAGPFVPGLARQQWQTKMTGWDPPATTAPHFTGRLSKTWPVHAQSLEIAGPEIAADSPDLPAEILALYALGCGKGGSLHRVAREKDGLSYRQEAVLWPTETGFVPRLIVAAIGVSDPDSHLAELHDQLIADIDAWTESDRARAIGMAEGSLQRGAPISPLYFSPDHPMRGSLGDQTFLEAYWISKTSVRWEPESMMEEIRNVSLPNLKEAAMKILTSGQLIVRKPS
jgi:hypothetical protein